MKVDPLRSFTVLLLLTLCGGHMVKAGEELQRSPLSLQGSVAGGVSLHSASFTQLPGVPNCCVEFGSALGWAGDLGVGLEYDTRSRLFENTIKIGVSAGFGLYGGTLTENEEVGNIIDGNEVTDGIVQHDIALSSGIVLLSPYVALPVPVLQSLSLVLGIDVGTVLVSNVDQTQSIVEPQDSRYEFLEGGREKLLYSGSLPDKASLQSALNVGLRYDLALNDAWTIAPMIRYRWSFTSVMTSTEWNVNTLMAGIQVRYTLPKAEVAPPPPPPPPPVGPP